MELSSITFEEALEVTEAMIAEGDHFNGGPHYVCHKASLRTVPIAQALRVVLEAARQHGHDTSPGHVKTLSDEHREALEEFRLSLGRDLRDPDSPDEDWTLHSALTAALQQSHATALSDKHRKALEGLREQKTASQIASSHECHTSPVTKWKKQAIAGLPGVFAASANKSEGDEKLVGELYEQIGRLKMELEWFKKKSGGFA